MKLSAAASSTTVSNNVIDYTLTHTKNNVNEHDKWNSGKSHVSIHFVIFLLIANTYIYFLFFLMIAVFVIL